MDLQFIRLHYICPYCFETHRMHDVLFRCANDPSHCAPEADLAFSSFRGMSGTSLLQRIVASPSGNPFAKFRMPREAKCDACGFITTRRVCPTCHSELPYTIGDYKDLIFGVIGAKEAGKSHYISVLINRIRNEIGASLDCSLQPIDDATILRYKSDFFEPIFKKHEIIAATRSARADARVRIPLVYSLSFMGKSLLKKRKITNVATTAFFDTAGEDLDSEDTMSTENKYIYNASGLIVLLDPLQLLQVRAQVPAGTPLPNENTEIEDIIARTANLIRKARRMKPHELIDIPVAIAFSKLDAIETLIDDTSQLKAPSHYDNSFNQMDFDAVNTEMEAYVREWSGDSLIQQIKSNFKEYAFFGFSALGCNPHGATKIPKLQPHRVEDPFVWLLWRKGLVHTRRQKLHRKIRNVVLGLLAVALAVFGVFLRPLLSPPPIVQGMIEVLCEPAGAYWVLDGSPMGATGVKKEVKPGIHDIRVWKDGFQERIDRNVKIEPGSIMRILARLDPVSTQDDKGSLEVLCDPAEANWSVDGNPMGLTGQARKMEPKTYVVKVSKDKFKDWVNDRVNIDPRSTVRLHVRLEPVSSIDYQVSMRFKEAMFKIPELTHLFELESRDRELVEKVSKMRSITPAQLKGYQDNLAELISKVDANMSQYMDLLARLSPNSEEVVQSACQHAIQNERERQLGEIVLKHYRQARQSQGNTGWIDRESLKRDLLNGPFINDKEEYRG